MLKNVLILANPGSGKGLAPEYADMLGTVLKETYTAQVEIRKTTALGDAKAWAEAAKEEGFDTVICLGGDGTVNEVVNGLMGVDAPPVFSFVPIGTANDLGRVLGFDMNPDRAIEQFKDLAEEVLDIGEVNGQYFMDIVAVGGIPTAVMETESEKKNKFGFFAYVLDGVKAVTEDDAHTYQISNSKGETFELDSHAMLVAMTSSIGGMENLVSHRTHKDGLFQFAGLKGNLVASAIDTLVNEGGLPRDFVDDENLLAFSDNRVQIHLVNEQNNQPLISNVDGDEGPALPLEIQVHSKALKVLKPRNEAQ